MHIVFRTYDDSKHPRNNMGQYTRSGDAGKSTKPRYTDKDIHWRPDGVSRLIRGGPMPKSGPVFLSTETGIAESYGKGRGVGLYDVDMRKVLVSGTSRYYELMDQLSPRKVDEVDYAGPELYSDPPSWWLGLLKRAGYIGYATDGGQYVRIEQSGYDAVRPV